jgi:hypothetical protein
MSREGLLTIDNRNGPGVAAEFVRAAKKDAPAVGAGQFYESATKTCQHCTRIVVLNPDRSRERNYCRKCGDYICDDCAMTMKVSGEHKSFSQIADEVLEAAHRRL